MDESPSLLLLETERLTLLLPPPSVAPLALDYYERNSGHLERWDPPRPEGFLSLVFWEDRLRRSRREFADGVAVRLFVQERGRRERIIGSLNITNMVRGAFQSANVGYSMDGAMQGCGYMTEALKEGVRFAFQDLGLHRLMAGYMPSNAASASVLKNVGFEKEGYAKEYLFIAGAWQDHILTSITNPDFEFPKD
jgi:ribosomal-protein-alanine N-acetyltransferase